MKTEKNRIEFRRVVLGIILETIDLLKLLARFARIANEVQKKIYFHS